MRKIILASSSPRRKELMKKIGLKFKAVPSSYVEKFDYKLDPLELAKKLSFGKANNVALMYKSHIVIGADTFVVLNGEFLGKPHNKDNARKMLEKISGKKLDVITGFSIIDNLNSKKISRSVKTKVKIKKLSKDEIKNYIKTKEPFDKAGAFGVSGIGSLIVEKIDGDFYNVVGLPLFQLSKCLKDFGIAII